MASTLSNTRLIITPELDTGRVADYCQDPRADAADAMFGLPPRSPGGNAFAMQSQQRHEQMLRGNAFYHAESHARDDNPTRPHASNFEKLGTRSISQSSSNMQAPWPGAFFASSFTRADTPKDGSGRQTKISGVISPQVTEGASMQMIQNFRQGTKYSPLTGLRMPTPIALHPALRDMAPVTPSPSPASQSKEIFKTPAAAGQISSRPFATCQSATRPARTSSKQTHFPGLEAGILPETAVVQKSGHCDQPACDVNTHTGVKLITKAAITTVNNANSASQNAIDGMPQGRDFAMPSSSHHDEVQPEAIPAQVLSCDNTMSDCKNNVKDATQVRSMSQLPPLKLLPSPKITENAMPTRRALIEESREQMQHEASGIGGERTPVFQSIKFTPRVKNVEFDVSSSITRNKTSQLLGLPPSPKKSSFLNRLGFGKRVAPLQAQTQVTNAQNITSSNQLGSDVAANTILHAQPKAQAVLVGSTFKAGIGRTASKRSIFARKSLDIDAEPKSPGKRRSFGLIESPRKPSGNPASHSEIALYNMSFRPESRPLGRSQSLKRLGNSIPPTPPKKDTPPDLKRADETNSTTNVGLGLEDDGLAAFLGVDSSPIISCKGRFDSSRFTRTPQLVTKPSCHSLHVSVVPGLMDAQQFIETKARLDGLDVEGFSVPSESRFPRSTPVYSPSMYSSHFCDDSAADLPNVAATSPKKQVNPHLALTPKQEPGEINGPSGQSMVAPSHQKRHAGVGKEISAAQIRPDEPHHIINRTANIKSNKEPEKRVSIHTVPIAYPELASDPSITNLTGPEKLATAPEDKTGTHRCSSGSNAIAADDDDDSHNRDSTHDIALFEKLLSRYRTAPATPLTHVLKKTLDNMLGSQRWVFNAQNVGRGAVPDMSDEDIIHSTSSDINRYSPLVSPPFLSSSDDSPRSLHPELLPAPLCGYPTLPIAAFVHPPKTTQCMDNAGERWEHGSDTVELVSAWPAGQQSQDQAIKTRDGNSSTDLSLGASGISLEGLSSSKINKLLELIADRDRQIEALLGEAIRRNESMDRSSDRNENLIRAIEDIEKSPYYLLPKTVYEPRIEDKKRKLRARVATNTAHDFYYRAQASEGVHSADDRTATPSKAVTSVAASQASDKQVSPTGDPTKPATMPSHLPLPTKGRSAKQSLSLAPSLRNGTMLKSKEPESPALQSSPDILKGSRRCHVKQMKTSVTRHREPQQRRRRQAVAAGDESPTPKRPSGQSPLHQRVVTQVRIDSPASDSDLPSHGVATATDHDPDDRSTAQVILPSMEAAKSVDMQSNLGLLDLAETKNRNYQSHIGSLASRLDHLERLIRGQAKQTASASDQDAGDLASNV